MVNGKLRIHTLGIAVLTLCIALMAGTAALAQEKPCAADVEKFCQGIQPGGGRIGKCLAQHKAELSPACKARFEEVARQIKGIEQVCEDDIMRYCPGVKPGGGRIARCLRQYRSELSAECKEKIAEVRKEMKKQKDQ